MAISVQKVLTKIFGSRNERLLKRYHKIVEQVNALEPQIAEMTDPQLRQRTTELREGLTSGKLQSADVMAEAFGIIRESMDRHIGVRAIFDPENKFDPDVLNDDMLERYDEVQRRMIAEGLSWQQVTIPPELYKEIRRMYPESRPPFRARCFDVQLIGGIVLYEGKIAEMATGEGKTFVAPLACFMRALEGHHCHVVTVNDYLVRRDATWVQPAFANLGITVGYIQTVMDPGSDARRAAYACDITYGTNAEFGFDFLRDNMKERASLQVQGPLDYAIVDEVDSILIDEARTPLIISGPAHDDPRKYREADAVARKLIELNKPWDTVDAAVESAKRAIKAAEGDLGKIKGDRAKEQEIQKRKEKADRDLIEAEKRKEGVTQYYEVELDRKSVHLTHEGFAAAQDAAGVGSFFVGANMEWPHLMEQAMRAHVVYEKDRDYVVERGTKTGQMEVIIVDEYTGRKMEGRQWSDGLHQAAEAKEKVPIKQETQTLATITLQNFFKMYTQLAGMTGTAMTEAEEFSKIYRLDVVTIPTNRPCVRADNEDKVFRTEPEKWEAIIEEIKENSDAGRAILVGTTSVEKSEMLSNLLKRKYGVEHEVLNAKHHEREAEIVARAGQQHVDAHGEKVGNVTIATNMAGRGTDIKLSRAVSDAGGLHVIGTERHTARRIDNQLRGRSGRQGDPGSSRFYVSLQDDLMKMFAGEWTIKVLGWIGMEEGMAIEDKKISKAILRAQKKVEERNFSARKQLLEYDEVNDYQRTVFYGMRQSVLLGRGVEKVIWDMIGQAISDAVDKYITRDFVAATISEWVRANLDVVIEAEDLRGLRDINDLERYVKDKARAEAETTITGTLGEYLGEDTSDVSGWDTKGLQAWAMSRFGVNWSQAQIRQMSVREVEEQLRAAAVEQVNNHDCGGLMKFLEPFYAQDELIAWARDKFGIEITHADLLADERTRAPKSAAEIIAVIEQQARQAYAAREVKYPVEHALTFAYGGEAGSADNPYAAEYVRTWVYDKYRVNLPTERIRSSTVQQLCDEIVKYQDEFLHGGKLEKLVDDLLAANPDSESLRKAVNERFNLRFTTKDWEASLKEMADEAGEEGQAVDEKTLRRQGLLDTARQYLRRELTDLEQFVLIQILDTSWKDHLYAMDMLKSGIGLHSFAEKDPRVLYKKEGHAFFGQMMQVVRDKVTDLIFRARVVGAVEARSAYREQAAVHEATAAYGVSEAMAASGETEQASSGSESGSGGGGTATAVKPIVRQAAKVGRNDPCPCGSGKKYKKCCGANAA
jgi:preprotein translocase subunit SecA